MNYDFWQVLRFLQSDRFSNIKDYVTKSINNPKFLIFRTPQNIVVAASTNICWISAIHPFCKYAPKKDRLAEQIYNIIRRLAGFDLGT